MMLWVVTIIIMHVDIINDLGLDVT